MIYKEYSSAFFSKWHFFVQIPFCHLEYKTEQQATLSTNMQFCLQSQFTPRIREGKGNMLQHSTTNISTTLCDKLQA